MTEPTPQPEPPKNKNRLQLSEVLTVDDLINFVLVKSRSRRGRVVVTGIAAVVTAGIVFVPLTRSSSAASPSTDSTVPVVTAPPNTDDQTLRVRPLLPVISPRVGGPRIGPKLPTTTIATTTTVTSVAAAPSTVAAASQPQKPAGGNGGGTKPPVTQAPPLTLPPDGGITVPSE